MPDVYLFGTAVYEARGLADVPYGLAHDIVVRWPGLHQFFVPLGAVRACQENAHKMWSIATKSWCVGCSARSTGWRLALRCSRASGQPKWALTTSLAASTSVGHILWI